MNRDTSAPVDILIEFHSSARTELVQRLTNRDTTLSIFLGVSGAIFAATASRELTDEAARMLLVIPLLGLGASAIHDHHNRVIGALGLYLAMELSDRFDDVVRPLPDTYPLRGWDWSEQLIREQQTVLSRLGIAGGTILVIPQVAALIFAIQELPNNAFNLIVITVGCGCVLASTLMLVSTTVVRRQQTLRIKDKRGVRP